MELIEIKEETNWSEATLRAIEDVMEVIEAQIRREAARKATQ
jgi:hypothetical protein